MAGKGPSPLLGYNTNLRRRGVLCHVQTEDSGIAHPHVITHVFTAGTIIGTRKRAYVEHLGATDLELVVRKLMQEQHKAMCIALRDGDLDANLPAAARDTAKMEPFAPGASPADASVLDEGDRISQLDLDAEPRPIPLAPAPKVPA